jgi:hypothetical protein
MAILKPRFFVFKKVSGLKMTLEKDATHSLCFFSYTFSLCDNTCNNMSNRNELTSVNT